MNTEMKKDIRAMVQENHDSSMRSMIERDNGILTFNTSDTRYEKTQLWLRKNGLSFKDLGTRLLYNTTVKALAVDMPLPGAA